MASNLAIAFSAGDIANLVNDADDCTWITPTRATNCPGQFGGKQEIADFFAKSPRISSSPSLRRAR
jgi:hypothetical protein